MVTTVICLYFNKKSDLYYKKERRYRLFTERSVTNLPLYQRCNNPPDTSIIKINKSVAFLQASRTKFLWSQISNESTNLTTTVFIGFSMFFFLPANQLRNFLLKKCHNRFRKPYCLSILKTSQTS